MGVERGLADALSIVSSAFPNTDPADSLAPREDPDRDGLSDEEELALGTNPSDPDTDGDGVSDLQEIDWGTDPTTARQTTTVDGVPSAFDGKIEPGTSKVFSRGLGAIASGYIRLMGLVRQDTTVELLWEQIEDGETLTSARTEITFGPRQYWAWGHDIGPAAIVGAPEPMTVTRLTAAVALEGDSVLYSFISSGGLANGPRGFLPMSPSLVETSLDFDILFAHGLADTASSWDSFAIMLERLAPDVGTIRTSVEPLGSIGRRAEELKQFLSHQDVEELYVVAHSMGGLDVRFVLTEAAAGNDEFEAVADSIRGVYTLATPHRGARLADLSGQFEYLSGLFDPVAPAVIDLGPGSRAISELNDAFDGDISYQDRTIPIVALVFVAEDVDLAASDGVVEVSSQAFGGHVISDIASTKGLGPGAGRHACFVPSRADAELESFEILARILEDIVARRAKP